MKKIYLLAFVLILACANSYCQNGKVVFIELKTDEPAKGGKEEPSQTIEYTVPTGKYLKIESALTSPVPPNTGISHLYLNGKMIAHYSFIRPPLIVTAPLPIYLPSGKYKFTLTGSLANAFVSGMEY